MHHSASCRYGHKALLIKQHPYTAPGDLSSIACNGFLNNVLGVRPVSNFHVNTRGNSQMMQGIGDYEYLLLMPVLSSTAGHT